MLLHNMQSFQKFRSKRIINGSMPATEQKRDYSLRDDVLWRAALEQIGGNVKHRKSSNVTDKNMFGHKGSVKNLIKDGN